MILHTLAKTIKTYCKELGVLEQKQRWSPLLLWPVAGCLRSSLMVISLRPIVTTLLPGSSLLLPPFSRASPST